MKSIKLDKIWEENKKFLLGTGGVVVVFLYLFSTISNYGAEARDDAESYHRERDGMQSEYQRVRDHYHESRHLLEGFETLERDLLTDYGLKVKGASPSEIADFGKELYFSKQIDEIWIEVNTKKTRQSLDCEIPKAIASSALGEFETDEDTRRNQKYLGILRRGMNLLVDSGMTSIRKPRLVPETANGIVDNAGHEVVFQRVAIEAEGSFQSFARVFEASQQLEREKKGGVQVLLLDLGPAKGKKKKTRELMGRFEFRALAIEKARDDRQRPTKRGRTRVRRRK